MKVVKETMKDGETIYNEPIDISEKDLLNSLRMLDTYS